MKTLTAILAATVLAAASMTDAAAQRPPPEPEFRQEPPRQQDMRPRVSLDQAVSIARRQVPGRVIGAETRMHRGRAVHQVKILTRDGTVRVVRVDGDTGRVLR